MIFISGFEDYFGEDKSFLEELTQNETAMLTYTDYTQNILKYEQDVNHPNIVNTYALDRIFEGREHFYTADSNIDDIDIMAMELGKILDITLGVGWGKFAADYIVPICNPPSIKLPQIIYDYRARSPNPVLPRPKLFNIINEVVDGKETGDAFRIWRQWYDYDFTIDIFHTDSVKARGLMKIFETIFESSRAHLQKMGVQKIRFAGEIDPRNSIRYRENVISRCLIYEICLEKIIVERVSTLQSINTITRQ